MNKYQDNSFLYPRKTIRGAFLNFILNNVFFIKLKRILFYPFTQLQLTSDITNVVYLNWMIPIQNITHLLPKDVKLKTYENNVLLTVLTYKHGNFRPGFLNYFKHLFASPLQSNWRFYVENNQDFGLRQPTVFFIKNCIDEPMYAVGSRVASNILQTHLPQTFKHTVAKNKIITEIQPGISNAPDLYTEVLFAHSWSIPAVFETITSDREKLIALICNQDAAIAAQMNEGDYAVGNIELKFQLSEIKPLQVSIVESNWLKDIIEGADCFAFLIPQVRLTTLKEKILKPK